MNIDETISLPKADLGSLERLNEQEDVSDHLLISSLQESLDFIADTDEIFDVITGGAKIPWIPQSLVFENSYAEVALGGGENYYVLLCETEGEDGEPRPCCAVLQAKAYLDDDGGNAVSIESVHVYDGGREVADEITASLSAMELYQKARKLFQNMSSVAPERALKVILEAARSRGDIAAYLDDRVIRNLADVETTEGQSEVLTERTATLARKRSI